MFTPSTRDACVSVVNAHGGHTRYFTRNAPTDACELYVLLGEDVWKTLTFSDDSTRVFVHLKNKNTDT